MLFVMVERGMDAEVLGDKGKSRGVRVDHGGRISGDEPMWAIMLCKELWKKNVWYDITS